MMRIIPFFSIRTPVLLAAVLLAALFSISIYSSSAVAKRHELDITLHPSDALLTGTAQLDMARYAGGEASVLLAPAADISMLQVDGQDAEYRREGRRIAINIPNDGSSLVIKYSCRFDDPVEEQPASMDNPGFGVMASISEKGTFLLPGSDWYPWAPESNAHYKLTVRAPRGVYAVTTGALQGHEDEEEESISWWDAWSPNDRLPLAAGRWVVERTYDGPVPVITYFSEDIAPLSARYMDAASRHIAFFEKLHGTYPFAQFAVVENFFPTGYGFPGFTLLGGRVLALPFIPETSLRHEIAHCWWGNGVLVDWEKGNWCEGLTNYVADYLSKERQGPVEALEYRVKTLRRYALVVPPDLDFPLTEFGSRTSPATQAVGYGKAMYVFHMLRMRVGDDAFWKALRDIYAEHLFQPISWDTFREEFAASELLGPDESERFFSQWVVRSGAPHLALEATRTKENDTWRVEAQVSQREPGYELNVPVVVETAGNRTESAAIELSQGFQQDTVSVHTDSRPVRVIADPEADIFRRLAPEEIPATINRLKGSQNLVAVVADALPDEARMLAQWVLVSLNQRGVDVLDEAEAEDAVAQGKDVFLFGLPASTALRDALKETPGGSMFLVSGTLPGKKIPEEVDIVFLVDKRTGKEEAPITAVLALQENAGLEAMASAARKLMHYGSYSYLLFKRGANQGKGIWQIRSSPMTVNLGE